MSIERFTRDTFERTLATIWSQITQEPEDTGAQRALLHASGARAVLAATMYYPMGIAHGEYSYALFVRSERNIRIVVRSSVDATGIAAETGANSIRLVVQCSDGTGWYSVGKAADAYTTRVSGWERRLEAKLQQLYQRWSVAQVRLNPGERIFIVKTAGPNQGRAFIKGGAVRFVWVD